MELHPMHLFEIYFQSLYSISNAPGWESTKHTHPCLESPDAQWPSTGKALSSSSHLTTAVIPDFTGKRSSNTQEGQSRLGPALWTPSPISVCPSMLPQHKTESDKVIQDLEVVGFLTQEGAPVSFSRTFLSTVAQLPQLTGLTSLLQAGMAGGMQLWASHSP